MLIKIGELVVSGCLDWPVEDKEQIWVVHIKDSPDTYSQEDFEQDLRKLADLLSRICPPLRLRLRFKAGGPYILPDWFLERCKFLGIAIELYEMNPSLIPSLLSNLASFSASSTVANPYSSSVGCTNLTEYLQGLCKWPLFSGHLLVGEAPGYRGCALTGIPFTSQRVLATSPHPFITALRPSLHITGRVTEPTATMVWNYLCGCQTVPALWNAFPFHPHQCHNPASNKRPTPAMITIGAPFLQQVLQILCPHTVIAVGTTAAAALRPLLSTYSIVNVPHPSYGNKKRFISGIAAVGIV